MQQQRMADNQQMSLAGELSRQGSLSPTMEALRPGLAGSVMESPDRQGEREQMMGEIAMSMMPGAGITAYHGSPHNFSKFDMSKIGTGEGAQAYGHGLYFAENPAVANEYAKNYKTRPDVEGMARSNGLGEISRDSASQIRRLANSGLDGMEAAKKTQWASIELRDKPKEVIAKIIDEYKAAMETSLYKVDIPDDQIAKMLDWDKPLSEQTESIKNLFPERFTEINRKTEQYLSSLSPQGRKVAESMMKDNSANLVNGKHDKNWNLLGTSDPNIDHNAIHDIGRLVDDLPSGGNLYHSIAADEAMPPFNSSKFSSGAVPASEYLRSKGIPGIKYLDQGSRGSGKGTSNFVLFSDEIAKILERNGQPIGDLAGTLRK